MQKLRLLILILLCFFSAPSFSSSLDYPLLDEIVFKFFRSYQPVNELYNGEKLKFMKTPKGWEIGVSYVDSISQKRDVKNIQLYWSSNSGEYIEMNYSIKDQNEDEYIDYYRAYKYFLIKQSYRSLNYSIHTYYGYDAYAEDIILKMDSNGKISHVMLYSLGEAFYSPSRNMMVSKSSIDSSILIKNALLGLQFKKELYEVNSGFTTVVGNIKTKYGNDLSALKFNTKLFFLSDETNTILHAKAYDLWMIEFAKNFLSHCPQNAILFTGGDNDTYPLLYVQDFYNYRKDITIINTTLLNRIELNEFLRRKDQAVDFSIDKNIYLKDKNKILVLEPTNESYDLIEWLKSVNQETTQILNNASLGQRSVYLLDDTVKMEWRINRARITSGELATLDIIASNYTKRPICFTANQNANAFLGLANYLKREGMVYVLDSLKSGSPLKVNLEEMEKNLLENSFWKEVKDASFTVSTNYYYAFYQLADEYIKQSKNEKAIYIVAQCLKLMPFDSKKINSVVIYLVDLYAKIGEEEKALKLLNNISEAMGANLDEYEEQDLSLTNYSFIDELNIYLSNVNTMLKISSKYGFLKNQASVENMSKFESRIKMILKAQVKEQEYMKMLIGAKPTLLNLIRL